MPFAVTQPQAHPEAGPLYAIRDKDGDILWTPDKRRVAPLSETDADAIAAEINRFASVEASVVGFTPSAAKP